MCRMFRIVIMLKAHIHFPIFAYFISSTLVVILLSTMNIIMFLPLNFIVCKTSQLNFSFYFFQIHSFPLDLNLFIFVSSNKIILFQFYTEKFTQCLMNFKCSIMCRFVKNGFLTLILPFIPTCNVLHISTILISILFVVGSGIKF